MRHYFRDQNNKKYFSVSVRVGLQDPNMLQCYSEEWTSVDRLTLEHHAAGTDWYR